MNAMKIAFSYFIVVGMPVVTFYGTVMGNAQAMNATTFMCWLTAVMVSFFLPVILIGGTTAQELKTKAWTARKVPYWLDVICDVIALGLLVVEGRFLLSGLWTYQMIVMVSLYNLEDAAELSRKKVA